MPTNFSSAVLGHIYNSSYHGDWCYQLKNISERQNMKCHSENCSEMRWFGLWFPLILYLYLIWPVCTLFRGTLNLIIFSREEFLLRTLDLLLESRFKKSGAMDAVIIMTVWLYMYLWISCLLKTCYKWGQARKGKAEDQKTRINFLEFCVHRQFSLVWMWIELLVDT